MRILLTGASGFIGGALCPLLQAEGHAVSALIRRPGSEPPGTRPIPGELTSAEALTAALAAERPDCVIHLAAEIASQRSAKKINEVNVNGTRRLVEACLKLSGSDPSKGPRLVFASTVVTGDPHGALLTEDTPLPIETPYGRSKQQGEQIVLNSGLPTVVIRPSHVYGAGGWYTKELIPRLRQPGRFAVIGTGANLWDVVRVEDVANALILAATRAPPGSTYHVADDEPITFHDFMALTAKALGVGHPRRIPAPMARLIAGRNAVAAVVRSARSSNTKIKQELGWQPQYPNAHQGIPDAIARL